MDNIIVGFSRPKAFFEPFSWFIRFFYWSPFSHSYVRIQLEGLNEQIIFQASGLVVNFVGETVFDSKENICREFTFPIKDKKALLQFAINQLGKPYSVTGVLGMMLVRFGQLIGIKIGNPFKYDQSSDFCSELVSYVLETYEGIAIDQPVANLAPADLLEILAKLPISAPQA